MGKIIIRKQVFAVKAEASQYTYNWSASAPAGADLIPCMGTVTYNPTDEPIKNETLLTHFGKLDDVPTFAKVEFKGRCYLNPSGTAGTAPLLGTLLKAAGFSETVVAVTSVTYKPVAASATLNTTFSAMLIEDGYGMGASGCQVTDLAFILEAGKPCIMEFTIRGAYQAVVAKTAPSLPSTLPVAPVFSGASVNGLPSWTTPEFRNWKLNVKNVVGDVIDANSSTNYGFKGVQITDRSIDGSIDPTWDPATADPFSAWRAGTTGAIGTGVIGSGSGNRLQFTVPRAQYNGPSMEDRNGYRAHTWPFDVKVPANSADGDDFSLAFT